MKFAIVIPSKNPRNLGACVSAIYEREETITPEQIIVVDDGAYSGCAIAAERARDSLLADVTWVPGAKPFIFARNINIGIRAALERDSETVILLNDDAMLATLGGFTALAGMTLAHPEYGVISAAVGRTMNPAQRPQSGNGLRREPRVVAFVAVCLAPRTIERVGLLDQRFSADYGWEDNDYCRRLTLAGLHIGIFDGCRVDHGSLESTFRPRNCSVPIHNGNARLFYEKWGDLHGARVPGDWLRCAS